MSKFQHEDHIEEWRRQEIEDVEFLNELYYGGDDWFDDDEELYEDEGEGED